MNSMTQRLILVCLALIVPPGVASAYVDPGFSDDLRRIGYVALFAAVALFILRPWSYLGRLWEGATNSHWPVHAARSAWRWTLALGGHLRRSFRGEETLSRVALVWGVGGNSIWLAVAALAVLDQISLATTGETVWGPLRATVDLERTVLIPGFSLYFPLSLVLIWRNSRNAPGDSRRARSLCAWLAIMYLVVMATAGAVWLSAR